MIVLLDAGPLGLVTNPRASALSMECRRWLADLLAGGVLVMVPEIADFEVRRELVRAKRLRGVARLDQAKSSLGYVPITTPAMLQAATFWAQARQRGQPTAPDLALDADTILAAQAVVLAAQEGDRVVIATTNPGHLQRFTDADNWRRIGPPPP